MITVLLVEDNDADARLTQEAMKAATREEFSTIRTRNLSEAVVVYTGGTTLFDIVLLDLGLPESQGLNTLSTWFMRVGVHTPVVVLSGLDDRLIMIDAMKLGAQDYLTKDEVIPGILCRVLRYAIERHTTHEEHAKRAQHELDLARQKLVEIADSLHELVVKDM